MKMNLKWSVGAVALAVVLAGCGGGSGAPAAAKGACVAMAKAGDAPAQELKDVCSCVEKEIKSAVKEDPKIAKSIVKGAALIKKHPDGEFGSKEMTSEEEMGVTAIASATKGCSM